MDMAIGVRDGLDVGVRDALSYWITKLRYCSASDEDPECRGKWNIDDMWRHWAEDHCVDDKKDYSGNERRIGMLQFAIPLVLVGFVCVAVLVHQATRPPAIARLRSCLRGDAGGLLAALKAERRWWRDDDETIFLMETFLADLKSSDGPLPPLRDALLHHFLHSDTASWESLRDDLDKLEALRAVKSIAENLERVHGPALANVCDLARRAAHATLARHKLNLAAAAAAPKTPTLSTRGIVRRATSLLSARTTGTQDAAADGDGDATTP